MPTTRSASSSAGTTQIGALVTTFPTGAVAGDVVLYAANIRNTLTPGTWTVDQGFTVGAQGENSGDATVGHTRATFYKILVGGESAPTLQWSDTGRWSWAGICIRPSSSGVLSINAGPTSFEETGTGGTTIASPAATATVSGVTSVLFTSVTSATANVAGLITATAPTSWVIPTNGQAGTASGTTNATRQLTSATAALDGQSGTVSPTAWSYSQTGATTWRGIVWHYLIAETVTAGLPPLVQGRWS